MGETARARATWRVGEVTITKFVEGVEHETQLDQLIPRATTASLLEIEWLRPHFVTAEGAVIMSIHAMVVETPGKRIIVDTCYGNDKPPPLPGSTRFLEELSEGGFPPESFDVVLCTHFHVDHVGWNTRLVEGAWVPTFRNARYLFNRAEYDFWSSDAHGITHYNFDQIQKRVFAESVKPVFDAGLADFVEPTHRVCDEVELVPTPGHSPGHVSVRIRSQWEEAFITGDMAHHPCQLTCPDWTTVLDTDPDQGTATRNRIWSHYSGSDALIIGSHWGGPTAGRIAPHGATWRLKV